MCLQILSIYNRAIGLMSSVRQRSESIPGRVIPKTQKLVLDSALLNTQQNKIRIKAKVEQSKRR